MESGGGTKLWCSKCKDIRECKVLWNDNISKGNFFNPEFPDLHWRERPRECNTCGYLFNTYEIEQSAIDELVSLRTLVKEIESSIAIQQKTPTGIPRISNSLSDD
jgi:hypothetical protein